MASRILQVDSTPLCDWNNAIYSDLMCDKVPQAERRWNSIVRRPAWQKAVLLNPFMCATHGLLELRLGHIAAARAAYEKAESLAQDEALRDRIGQKWLLEMGRHFRSIGRSEDANASLEKASVGPDTTFASEASQLLGESS